MPRLSRDETGLLVAKIYSMRSTCPLRSVGCLLVDKDFHTLCTGYNGSVAGRPHCIDHPCRAFQPDNRDYIDRHRCEAQHAEANALLRIRDTRDIYTCYTYPCSPCGYCIKLLLGTSCKRIVFIEEYPDEQPKEMWLEQGKEWVQCQEPLMTSM